MPSLLSPQDKANIRLAIQDVTDTFFVTPLTYHRAIESIDRFNEDRADLTYEDIDLNVLFENEDEQNDEVDADQQGKRGRQQVQVTVALSDSKTAGLVDSSNLIVGVAEKDYFTVNGQDYEVTYLGYDGPLDQENVLVIIKGKVNEHKT